MLVFEPIEPVLWITESLLHRSGFLAQFVLRVGLLHARFGKLDPFVDIGQRQRAIEKRQIDVGFGSLDQLTRETVVGLAKDSGDGLMLLKHDVAFQRRDLQVGF